MDGSLTYWIDGKPVVLDDYGELSSWYNGAPFVYHVTPAVGGAIKSYNGVLWANIKSINGVAIAAIKAVNGVAV